MANWTASYGRYITLKVTATELNVNTANNTSQVRVQTSLYYGGGTTAVNGYPQTLSVSVNGTSIGTQTGITYNLSSGSTKTLNTYTSGAIGHNSDGSKSVNVTVNITDNKGDNGRISQTLTLTKIARASTPTLSASTVAIGSAVTINTNRATSSFTHTATFKFGSLTKTITTKNTNASFSYTPTADLATQIPNSSSGYGWVTLTTYSGTTAIGTKSVKLTLTVPSNSTFNPTITAPVVSEGVANVTSKVGSVYVQGKSKFVVKATPTTRGGATVKSVVFKVKTTSYTGSGSGSGKQYSATTGTLSTTGSHAISVTVTDSRNRTATANIATAPNVLAYSPPKITSFKVSRRAGATTTVDVSRTVTYNIVGSNTVNVKIDRQQVGSSTVTNVQNVNLTTGTSNSTAPSASTGNADASSYKFTLTVTDKFSTATSSITISTAGATMSWGRNGISVGGIYNNAIGGALQVGGALVGGLYVSGSAGEAPLRVRGIEGNNGSATANTTNDSLYLNWVGKNAVYTGGNLSVNGKWTIGYGVVSSGTNANGDYMQFENGLQICWNGYLGTQMTTSTTYGNIFTSSTAEWVFPATFKTNPALIIGVRRTGGGGAWGIHTGGLSTTSASGLRVAGSHNNTVGVLQPMAIGRWK